METLRTFWNYELIELFGSPIQLKNLVLFAIVFMASVFLLKLYRAFVYKTLSKTEWCNGERADMIYRIGRIILYLLFISLIIQTLNLGGAIRAFFDHELVHETKEGGFSMKVYNIFLFVVIIIVGRMVIKLIQSILKTRLQANPRLDAGQEFSIRKLVNYGGYILLFIIAVHKTRDGIIITMPNRKLTSDNINNYSTQSPLCRFNVDIGVAYGSDVKMVKELLHAVALAHPDVSKSKPILVWFTDFGDSALTFKLLFWSTRTWDIQLMQSEMRFAIHDALKENKVRIPFPQRDIHIRREEDLTFGGDVRPV